jgi:predicted permease
MLEDLRYAVRSVTRARGLTAVLVLSLALAIGANATVCGAVYALLIRAPAGVEDAGSLVAVYTSEFSGASYGRTSGPDYRAIATVPSFDGVAAADDNTTANVSFGDVSILVRTAAVTPNYFDLLGMAPHAGRLLTEADAATTPRGAVISAALAERFGSIDTVLGQTIDTGSGPFTVVGVTPPKFRGLQASRVTDVWIPMPRDGAVDRGDRRLFVIGRTELDPEPLQRQLRALHEQLSVQYPATNRGAVTDPEAPRRFTPVEYSPLQPGAKTKANVVAAVVVGAVALLLVSVCVNAGTLLLSRAMARRRELAVRMALGARRGRLIRQLLTESLLVSLMGGALGLLFAYWTSTALPSLFAPEHAELLDTRMDPLLIGLTLGFAAAAGALFGIAPALQGTGAPATLALRADAGGISEQHGGTRVRGLLITAQLALSTLLLIGTGLLMSSLAHTLEGDLGFAARDVAVLQVQNPGGNCTIFDALRGARFQQQVAETLPKTPGLRAVGFAGTPPLGRGTLRRYSIQAGATVRDRVDLNVTVVSAGYFGAMGIPIIEGRRFDAGDGARAEPVVIVDELLARRYFGATAAGQHLLDADGERLRVVGVVRSGRYRTLQDAPEPTVFVPLTQEHVACGYFFVRTADDPAALLPLVVDRVTAVDAGVTISRAITLDRLLSESLVMDRLTTTLVGLCGVIALLMGAIGVYGVMSDAVLRRTREIGLRMALGAGRPQVAWLVFAEALSLTAAGVFAGILASLVLGRIAATLVHGLPAVDRLTLTTTPAVLAVVVVLAAVVPLRRALAVSPTIALRAE